MASESAAAFSRSTPVRTAPRPTTAAAPAASLNTTALVKADPTSIPATLGMRRPPYRGFGTLVHLLQREQRRADGAGKVCLRAHLQARAQHLLERTHHPDVVRHAAGQGDLRLDGHATRQRNRTACDRQVHSVQDVLRLLALREIRKNVGLDKHRAHRGDLYRVLA